MNRDDIAKVIEALETLDRAHDRLIDVCKGNWPTLSAIDEKRILSAALNYRQADNARNRAIAEAVRELAL